MSERAIQAKSKELAKVLVEKRNRGRERISVYAELIGRFVREERRAAIEAAAQRLEVLSKGNISADMQTAFRMGSDAIRALKEAE